MKKTIVFAVMMVGLFLSACKDQLDIKNPNSPTPDNASNERGIYKLASGALYANGFVDLKFVDGVPGRFWTGAVGFHEVMGDIIGEEAANVYGNQLGCPNSVKLDDGTVVPNPQSPPTQKALIQLINKNAQQGSNFLYYEWAYMYGLNGAMNVVLDVLGPNGDQVAFASGGDTKSKVIQAWAHFWKGFAYSRVGSIYVAGIINDLPLATNGNYVTSAAILAEAENQFAKAETILNGLSAGGDYDVALGTLLPELVQSGKGGILTPTEWKHNINTLRARNILVNKKVTAMTAADWNQVLTYTANGVTASDHIFILRSNATGDLMSATSGNIPAKTWGSTPQGGTYKVSERLIQDFKTGDLRLDNNFHQETAWIGNSDRGNAFNTRWALYDGGNGIAGTVVMCDRSVGGYELYTAGFYEENELMKAEANIYLNNIDTGLGSIDAVRDSQGAGLAHVTGTGLTQAQAVAELRSERRVALAFRGFAFYDARRWDVLANGRTGAVVVDKDGNLNTNAEITYGFVEVWPVPDNELVYNKPAEGSADVTIP